MCNWKPLANEKLVLSNGVKLEIQTTLKSSMSINRRATHTELKNIFEGSLTHNILSVFFNLTGPLLVFYVSQFCVMMWTSLCVNMWLCLYMCFLWGFCLFFALYFLFVSFYSSFFIFVLSFLFFFLFLFSFSFFF